MKFNILTTKIPVLILLLFLGFKGNSQNYTEAQEKKMREVFKSVDYYIVDRQNPDSATIALDKLKKNAAFDFDQYEAEFIYREAIIEMQKRNHQKSIEFFKEAITKFKETNKTARIGKSEKFIGICLESLNKRGEALKAYLDSEKKLPLKELPSLYSNLANLYANLGDNKTAIQYGLKGYSILQKTKEELPMIECNNILGVIYTSEKNYPKALEFHTNALNLSIKNKLSYYIAIAYASIGRIEAKRNNHRKALEKYFESIKNFEEKDYYSKDLATINLDISESYLALKEYANAEKYANSCYTYCISENDIQLKSGVEITLGKIYAAQNNFDKAIATFNNALISASKTKRDNDIAQAYLELSKIYEKRDGNTIAFEYFKKYAALKEKITLQEQLTDTEELQIRFDVSQYKQNLQVKNQEIELLKFRSTQLKYQYALLILLIIGLLIFAFRQSKIIKISKRNEKYLEEINALKEEALSREVDFKNKQVTDFALQIQEQNNLLLSFKQKLGDIKNVAKDPKTNEEIKTLQLLINDSIDLNNEKVQLSSEIKNSQESFLFNLRSKFPELNEKEIQIATYLRLNLNTKQIASQLNISEQSVNNYRTFIRKKLGLDKSENLSTFLGNL